MKMLAQYTVLFRQAIEKALEAGEFYNDRQFRGFPHECCGETSDLLAEYLLKKGYKIRL